jgi:hypothetical protein
LPGLNTRQTSLRNRLGSSTCSSTKSAKTRSNDEPGKGSFVYSVPDTARRRVVDVHVFADEVRIFEAGVLIVIRRSMDATRGVSIRPIASSCRRYCDPW